MIGLLLLVKLDLLLHFSDLSLRGLACSGSDWRLLLLLYIRIDFELIAIDLGLACGGSNILRHLLHF